MTNHTFVKKWNIYCEMYDCSKCPFRKGVFCFYTEEDIHLAWKSGSGNK